jgi:hypothetical protein
LQQPVTTPTNNSNNTNNKTTTTNNNNINEPTHENAQRHQQLLVTVKYTTNVTQINNSTEGNRFLRLSVSLRFFVRRSTCTTTNCRYQLIYNN